MGDATINFYAQAFSTLRFWAFSLFFCRDKVLFLILCFFTYRVSALPFSVVGIDDNDIKSNVETLLNTTDIEQQTNLDPFWQKHIREVVEKAVQPYGYYNSAVDAYVDSSEIVIEVALNAPTIIANITQEMIGEGREHEGFSEAFDSFPLTVGDVLNQPDYERYKTKMFNYALANGFFDFTWEQTRLDLIRETNQAFVLLFARSGPQYYFGDFIIKGDDKSLDIIRRLSPFETGEIYDAALLTRFNRLLNETDYFQRAVVRPVVKNAVAQQVPLEVTLIHRPRDNFNVGIGYSTDTKLRVPLSWERPWVNRKGHALNADLFLSEREQEASAIYKIPITDVINDYATFNASYSFLNDDNRDTNSETLTVSFNRIRRKPDSKWQHNASLTYLDELFTQGDSDTSTRTRLLMPGYSVSYVDGKGELNNRIGVLLSTSLQAGSEELASDIDIIKATATIKWITQIDQHRLYLRGEAGFIETDNFAEVPSTLRFFTGGDQSIRGFTYQTISSVAASNDADSDEIFNIGGKELLVASIEYAYQVNDSWRAAVFLDAGTAAIDIDDGYATGIGVGAHWLSPIGPIRLYIAHGRNGITDEVVNHFHFILGPEL